MNTSFKALSLMLLLSVVSAHAMVPLSTACAAMGRGAQSGATTLGNGARSAAKWVRDHKLATGLTATAVVATAAAVASDVYFNEGKILSKGLDIAKTAGNAVGNGIVTAGKTTVQGLKAGARFVRSGCIAAKDYAVQHPIKTLCYTGATAALTTDVCVEGNPVSKVLADSCNKVGTTVKEHPKKTLAVGALASAILASFYSDKLGGQVLQAASWVRNHTPSVSMPKISMPKISMPSMPKVSIPSCVPYFGKKAAETVAPAVEKVASKGWLSWVPYFRHTY